jgi:SAM-dependent methyltransferase
VVSLESPALSVIWHDLECGAYTADLRVWRELAAEHGDPVLDIGAGTGRVTLDLARHGHRVTALDRDRLLVSELERRAHGLPVTTACADARSFDLGDTFALIIVPMQTVQLLGGRAGREDFLRRAARHLGSGGVLALAIIEQLEGFGEDPATPLPLPDIRELGGTVYSSQPTAVRERPDGFILERTRERIGPAGERDIEPDVIHLDRLSAAQLEDEARGIGLTPRTATMVPETPDHVGSVVVILGG